MEKPLKWPSALLICYEKFRDLSWGSGSLLFVDRNTRTMSNLLPPVVTLLAVASASSAQEASSEMGKDIAEEYCVQCHNVDPNGPFKLDPPSFAAIATYRSKEQIRQRIVTPIHDSMPSYTEYMIGQNIDDMVAYIVSLGNPPRK
jgi:mono/diheme cytochrome c family protein